MSAAEDRQHYSIHDPFATLRPALIKRHGIDCRKNVNSPWRRAHLREEVVRLKVNGAQVGWRRAEAIKRAHHALRVVGGVPYPNVKVFGRPGGGVRRDCIRADYEE